METKRTKIVYFSGTGGTRMAAEIFKLQFEKIGVDVAIHRLKTEATDLTPGDFELLILLYPVYASTVPEPVIQWIEQLQRADGIPAAVISVSGGGEISPNTACRVRAIKKLEAKGYQVTYEDMLVMPSNIAIETKYPADKMLLDILPEKVGKIVEDLQKKIVRRTHPKWLDRGIAFCGKAEKYGAHFFGKRIRVLETCNGCGWCVAQCSSKNISLVEGKPVFGGKCYFCMGCLYGCPNQALKPGVWTVATLKNGYDIDTLAAAQRLEGHVDLERQIPGFLWGGVRKYLKEGNQK